MVRPSDRRGDDDLGPVTRRTGVRGQHSTSDLPSTPTTLLVGLHYDTGTFGSSTQPLFVPFRSRPPFQSHLSHTSVPYAAYRYAHLHSQPPPAMVGAVQPDSSYSTHGYTAGDYDVSSSKPFIGRQSSYLRFEGDRSLGEEPNKDKRADNGGDGDDDDDDDDDDDGEDAGDEEQPVPLVPVAPASGFDGRPRHKKGKGLTGSFISDKARDVLAPTQRKRVKASDWEQTCLTKRGPVDSALIPSYGGHVDRGLLKYRSRYMALTRWSLTDAEAWIYMYFPMFAPAVRPDTQSCKPYIQQYPRLGYKTKHKLLDIHLRLDMIRAVNGVGLTRIRTGLHPFIVGRVKILYPQTRIRTNTHIDSIKWV
ncbi:hypothetical protein M9H77_34033 [Catharanthus roseus]|uniref:Uncharacterized protein n=1 Tax=Catharanthus roseus TaxID=4058 RepID=A0ACB9ZKR9_CATRO|nr:hypothetical protein M9H77_34033 [Catharanthus roseus]